MAIKYVVNAITGKMDAVDGAGGSGVTSTGTLTDNAMIRGDGGSRGVQDSGVLLDDSDSMTGLANLAFNVGTGINEFSIDGTLIGDSDNAVPTEKAVKTYVDAKVIANETYNANGFDDPDPALNVVPGRGGDAGSAGDAWGGAIYCENAGAGAL